eukprot:SAG31_NODE_21343_length_552_cov_0.673289_2_plen_45_part_01
MHLLHLTELIALDLLLDSGHLRVRLDREDRAHALVCEACAAPATV